MEFAVSLLAVGASPWAADGENFAVCILGFCRVSLAHGKHLDSGSEHYMKLHKIAPGKIKDLFKQETCFYYYNQINHFLAANNY